MAAKLTSSQLIRFSADAGDGGDDEAEEDRVTLELVTELRGVVSRAASSCRLCASLLIEFVVSSLCARVRLSSISPIGHEPLELTLASYGGSTCGYQGPAAENEPFRTFAGYAYTETDVGETLVITYPRQLDDKNAPRITEYFGPLPRPVISFEPPLVEGEPNPYEEAHPQRGLLDGLNARRGEMGLSVLGWNTHLAEAIQTHVEWLLDAWPDYCAGTLEPPLGWSSHDGPAGLETPAARASAESYPATETVGELVALAAQTVADVLDAWWDDAAQRAVWIEAEWQALGAARVAVPGEPGRWVYGVLLGSLYQEDAGELKDGGALRRVAFRSLDAQGNNQGSGVRLPMRLIGRRPEQTGEVEVKALIHQEAPGFTISDGLIATDRDPVWSVTGKELADALQTPETSPDEITDWELYWRVYKGSGDMVYGLQCDGAEVQSRYVDRRDAGAGGGFGTFQTQDLLAARVRVEPSPYPWLIELSDGRRINADCVEATHWREAPSEWIGVTNPWRRSTDGLLVKLQTLGGRIVPRLVPPGLASYMIAIGCSCAIRDGDGVEQFQYLTAHNEDWGTHGRIYRRALLTDAQPVLMVNMGLPQRADGRWPDELAFSADGLGVMAVVYGSTLGDPGNLTHVWVATLAEVRVPEPTPADPDRTVIRLSASAWGLKYVQPELLIEDVVWSESGVTDVPWHATEAEHNHLPVWETSYSDHRHYHYRWRAAVFAGAGWRDNTPIVQESQYTAEWEYIENHEESATERAADAPPESEPPYWVSGYGMRPWEYEGSGGEHLRRLGTVDLALREIPLSAGATARTLLGVPLYRDDYRYDRSTGSWTRTPYLVNGEWMDTARGAGPRPAPDQHQLTEWRALSAGSSVRLGSVTAVESGRFGFESAAGEEPNPQVHLDLTARMWADGMSIDGQPLFEASLAEDFPNPSLFPAPPSLGGLGGPKNAAEVREFAAAQVAYWRGTFPASGVCYEPPGPAGGPIIAELSKRVRANELSPWVITLLGRTCLGGALPEPLAAWPPYITNVSFISPRACIDHAKQET